MQLMPCEAGDLNCEERQAGEGGAGQVPRGHACARKVCEGNVALPPRASMTCSC